MNNRAALTRSNPKTHDGCKGFLSHNIRENFKHPLFWKCEIIDFFHVSLIFTFAAGIKNLFCRLPLSYCSIIQ